MAVRIESEAREGPMGRRERKKLDVQQRLRSAAAELFREKGYEATTVEEIAERADVAKGTFFNHFPRKDALLEALGTEMLEALLEETGPAETWEGPTREQLLRLFLRLGELAAADTELSKVMIIENMRTFWMRTSPAPEEEQVRRLIAGALERGRARGEVPAEVDSAVAARVLEALYVTSLVEWLRSGGPFEEYRAELSTRFDIVFRGLGTDPRGGGA